MTQQNKNMFNSDVFIDDRFDEAPSFTEDAEVKRQNYQKEQAERVSKLGGGVIYAGTGRHIDYSRKIDDPPRRAVEVPER